jgi:acyl-CoA dehydrogenase
MPFALDPSYDQLRAEAEAVAEAAVPFADEADESTTVNPEIRRLLQESGLCALMVPAAFGGRDETIDPVAVCLVREVFSGSCAHLDALFALQGIGSFAISRAGSEEQRRRWLPAIGKLDALAALALTEPHVGSDLKNISTRLEAEGDELVLAGAKSFISNGGAAAFYTTLAREGDGYSLVLVPADAAGLSVSPSPDLLSPHVIGELAFDGVRLPASERIGARGEGFDNVLATLAMFRVSVAGAAVGVAQAAVEEANRHAQTRMQSGRPLARRGAVGQMLADSWTDLEMARLITYRAAERAKADPSEALIDSSMAKLAATEAAGRIVDRSVQTMGRFGLIHGSRIERLYRKARIMRITEGSSEVLRQQIARARSDA